MTTHVARVAAACAIALAAGAARAEPVAAGAVLRVEHHRIDGAAFKRMFAASYNVELRRVIVADIDRDGDADVLAATDRELLVWVNDGAGRLVSQPPARAPLDTLQSQRDGWTERSSPNHDTIQNDAPTPRLASSRRPAPPERSSAAADCPADLRASDAMRGTPSPRAPPAAV